jgi:hypothetical protein
LNTFKASIDSEKFLKFLFGETKTSKGMKSGDQNNMSIGRMMVLGACIESKLYI